MRLIELLSSLSPWRASENLGDIGRLGLCNTTEGWKQFYNLSLTQWCAPLLYELLRNNNSLGTIPAPTRALFRCICLKNRLRNQLLKKELVNLLIEFSDSGINAVLLKGAATFADDLYGNLGSRTMLDLDLLVLPERLKAAIRILVNHGYVEEIDPGKAPSGQPTDNRHAHINGYRKPGTPVHIELHYNIAYGQGGRILPAAVGWQQTSSVTFDGVPTLIFNPTYRLLHNTIHGLIPSCDYIKGEIRLWHILEFSWLAKRYWQEIDWQAWLDAAKRENCTTAFLAWLCLAHRLLAMPIPHGVSVGWWSRLQGERLLSATLLQFRRQSLAVGERLHWWEWLLFGLHRLYYWGHLPGWVWRNVCYAKGWRNVVVRVRCFGGKVMSRRSWGKV